MILFSIQLLIVHVVTVSYGCLGGQSAITIFLKPLKSSLVPVDMSWDLTLDDALVYSHNLTDTLWLGRCFAIGNYSLNVWNVGNSTLNVNINEFPLIEDFMISGDSFVTQVDSSINNMAIHLRTDEYPAETYWELMDSEGSLLESYMPGEMEKGVTSVKYFQVLDGNYTFHIRDSYGDGICCKHGAGFYRIVINEETYYQGGEFSYEENINFRIFLKNTTSLDLSSGDDYEPTVSTHLHAFRVAIVPDQYPEEFFWYLINRTSDVYSWIATGGASGGSQDIPDGVYEFYMNDIHADGICCEHGVGFYDLALDEKVFYNGDGNFGKSVEVLFFIANGSASLESAYYDSIYGTTNGGISPGRHLGLHPGVSFIVVFLSVTCLIILCIALYKCYKRRNNSGYIMDPRINDSNRGVSPTRQFSE